MPTAALGTWLFLAGEAMFFAGLLSAFLVLQSAPANRLLFARSAAVVGHLWPAVGLALLIASSVALWRLGPGRAVAALAVGFLAVQAIVAWQLSDHGTIVTATTVYDGRLATTAAGWTVDGRRVPLTTGFDVHAVTPADLRSGPAGRFTVPTSDVRLVATYGPARNNYFALFALVTGAHAVHVVGGLAALAWLAVRRRRGTATVVHAASVTLYWQFVNGVGAIAILLLAIG